MSNKNKPRVSLVSSLSMAFKKNTAVCEDVDEVKKQHRANLNTLVDDYMNKVSRGEAEGIRNAKELVEVIKADMLLLGEATDITETNTSMDDLRIRQVASIIDNSDPSVQGLMDELFAKMNGINDELGDNTKKSGQSNEGVEPLVEEDDVQEDLVGVPEETEELEGVFLEEEYEEITE